MFLFLMVPRTLAYLTFFLHRYKFRVAIAGSNGYTAYLPCDGCALTAQPAPTRTTRTTSAASRVTAAAVYAASSAYNPKMSYAARTTVNPKLSYAARSTKPA